MPLVFRWNGCRFHFFSNEGDPREPVHVHVTCGTDTAKFWLYPTVAEAYNYGFKAKALREFAAVIEERRAEIEEAWDEHFG